MINPAFEENEDGMRPLVILAIVSFSHVDAAMVTLIEVVHTGMVNHQPSCNLLKCNQCLKVIRGKKATWESVSWNKVHLTVARPLAVREYCYVILQRIKCLVIVSSHV